MHLSTPCFNTNRFKRQTAFRLVATRLGLNMTKIATIQTATHMVLMWNSVECRSGLKEAFSENVSKKQHGLKKPTLEYTIQNRGFTRNFAVSLDSEF